MKFCQHCGKELLDDAIICPGCGSSAQEEKKYVPEVDDSVSAGLVILAVLMPIFGLIYWPVKAKTRPSCAKACGIAAIVSWVLGFLISSCAR